VILLLFTCRTNFIADPATGGAVTIINRQNSQGLTFESLSVTGNSLWVPDVDGTFSASGGAFFVKLSCDSAYSTLSNSLFEGNTIISNLTVSNAIVSLAGAGLYFEGDASAQSPQKSSAASIILRVGQTSFVSNRLRGTSRSEINQVGAGLAIIGSSNTNSISVLLSSVVASNNTIECRQFTFCSGASVFADADVDLHAENSDFSYNQIVAAISETSGVSVAGAAIKAEILSASNCSFRGNVLTGQSTFGAALVAAEVDVENCTFENNAMFPGAFASLGVAISVASTNRHKKTAKIKSSRFIENVMQQSGKTNLRSGGGAISLSDPFGSSFLLFINIR
jgi:hypothetical protein